MMMAFRILLVVACAGYVLLAVRQRNPGLGLSFLGLALITGAPLLREEQTVTTLGWIGAGLILVALVVWIVQYRRNRQRRARV